MGKKPDLSDLTKKIDLGGLVNNLKSLVNPGGDTPDVDANDSLGLKIAKISLLIQNLVKEQQEHTKSLVEINKLLNEAFKDLEAIRAADSSSKPAAKKEKAAPPPAADEDAADEEDDK